MKEFPTYFTSEHALSMTLRDYFAAKALQGYLTRMAANPLEKGSICEDMQADTNTEAIAKASYLFADAMLKAREQ